VDRVRGPEDALRARLSTLPRYRPRVRNVRHAAWIARDALRFMARHKRWWLLPVIVASLVVAGALALSHAPGSPFLYVLF
jgi:hypothetical protein